MTFADVFSNFIDTTGFAYLIADPRCLIMIAISCVLLYLAIVKGFEPLLLVPILSHSVCCLPTFPALICSIPTIF